MLLDMIRALRGYVVFGVSGRFPERFINITVRNGIPIWDVNRSGACITAAMYRADYRRVRSLARASGVRLSVRKKCGMPVYAYRWRDRMGVVIGAFVFLLTIFVMSQFIWSIEITGLDTISESEMRSLLSDHGLYIGAFKPGLDYQGVSRAVMLDNGKVGWMAVNVAGSYASVEIKEEASAPEIPDYHSPANVKARRDGTILRIDARQGEKVLQEGSGVVKGQLVVSGVMENKNGGARLVRADAAVLASTAYSVDFSVPDCVRVTLPDGAAGERYTLSFFGLRIPLSGYACPSPSAAVYDRCDCLTALDTVLPAGVITERVTGLSERLVLYDENSAKELLRKQAQLYELFTLKGCTVTDRRERFTYVSGVYTLSVTYDCIEDIAEQVEIGVEP